MRRRMFCLLLTIVVTSGCGKPAVTNVPSAGSPAASVPSNSAAAEPGSPEIADREMFQQVTALYQQAKETGATQASSAHQWLSDTLEQSVATGEAATEQTTAWISEQFHSARSAGETTATSARDWVMQDIQRMSSWQYKSETFTSSDRPEQIIARLNELGAKRWECILVDADGNQENVLFSNDPSEVTSSRFLPATF